MKNYYEKLEEDSMKKVRKMLKRPIDYYDEIGIKGFDPWEIFPIYGSYSSEFDDMAIDTLTDILNGTFKTGDKYGLSQEIFREMLCNMGLCNYGTSPRTCFANESFMNVLPEYINKWKEYYKLQWN